MKVVIQRVSHASCTVDGEIIGQIQDGLLLLVGFNREDDASVLSKMIRKIVNMRIFGDEEGKLNRSVLDIKGEVLSISQFTLYASCKKGNRPSFIEAAPAEQARMLYDQFNALLEQEVPVQKGVFQADMKIDLLNDGPITIVLDSREV
ncbi:D-aminoacyl-tRNA deacylase [uncultured Allobaculum sp.]|uniref:D-aminoacyl-tRNA deacylase n=1 Tax=uncultured Allobaculum sp. TaxID=1187017 RepID=UPI002585728C|nr:D-aminoacyl-tRNA deacylase [uncultured Allobaculum sp.]